MIQKIVRTGNSLAITIPAKFVKRVGLKAGDRVKSTIKAEISTISYKFLDIRQLPLSNTFLKENK